MSPGGQTWMKRAAHHRVDGDRAAALVAAVHGVVAVVPHHEDVVLGHGLAVDRRLVGRDAVGEVRLLQALAVDVDDPVAGLDHVPGEPDDPLDEVLDAVGPDLLLGQLEHHDVAPVDVVEVVAELVDEHPVALLERGLHRGRRDVERLEEEGLHDQGHDEGAHDHGDPLDGGPDAIALLLLLALGAVPGRLGLGGRGADRSRRRRRLDRVSGRPRDRRRLLRWRDRGRRQWSRVLRHRGFRQTLVEEPLGSSPDSTSSGVSVTAAQR